MTHQATVNIPAAIYDPALAFCNARLAEQGKPPIDALPAGYACRSLSCPCGMASGVPIGLASWGRGMLTHPHNLAFPGYFDEAAMLDVLTLPVRVEGGAA